MRVLLLGDSISVGYGLTDEQLSFVKLISKKYQFTLDVIAKCGMTIQDVLKIDIATKYDIAIIFIGTNGSVSSTEIDSLIFRVCITARFLERSNKLSMVPIN